MNVLEDLKVWNKAMKITIEIYRLTNLYPIDERFGLVSQMRRSALSIPSNIAEGAGRNSSKEFVRFLSIAQGSSYELYSQIILSVELGFIHQKDVYPALQLLDEIQRMNFALQLKIKNDLLTKD